MSISTNLISLPLHYLVKGRVAKFLCCLSISFSTLSLIQSPAFSAEQQNTIKTFEEKSKPYGEALELFNNGHLIEAKEKASQYVQLIADDPDGHHLLGTIYLSLNDFLAATNAFIKAIKLNPGDAEGYFCLSVSLWGANQFDLAEKMARKAIDLKPNDGRYHATLGRSLLDQKKLNQGIDELRKAFRLDPSNYQTLKDIIPALVESNRKNEALAILHLAGESEKASKEVLILIADFFVQLDEPASAKAPLLRSIDIDERFAEAHCLLGAILFDEKNFRSALNESNIAVLISPSNPKYQELQAKCRWRLGDKSHALWIIRGVIERHPDWAMAYVTHAAFLMEEKKPTEAKALLVRAKNLDPELAEVDRLLTIVNKMPGSNR